MSYTLLKEEEEAGITATQDTRSLPSYTRETSKTRALSKIVALTLLVVAASFLGGLFALLGYRVPTFAIPSSSSSSSSSSSPSATTPFLSKSTPHSVTELQCGTSPAEARSLDCVLDLLAMSWVRPACYDKELTEEFLAERNWTWTTDPWGKHHLSKSEVLDGDWEYVYVDHCYTAAYDHIEHCGDRLVANTGEEVVGVPAILKYPSCGPGSLGQETPAYWIYEGEVQYNTKKQEGLYADHMKMEHE
ncbi:hypothetical protein BO79DRAFT_280829 [Aspergillus costaricaensis CBS 115574]|uniref:Uncharacterized protein n=1 Tax=Aspergillus costaricaensis CBS 115574 TaxID=1448317 RepID=A0ACD1IL38_9EURO|nr:hypothetical protein BO79DRAFT_280829 [Aspergillus costaricaensis CBS 115574]RAK90747.1 hypothetical protein BO79DRAFT_280829 [Aspergillus costaricaensis CBS 115574]